MNLKEKIMDIYKKYDNKYTKPLIRKAIRLLKIVLVDEETNLDKISKFVPIGIGTIKKYAEQNEIIEILLTKEEYAIFKKRVNYILKLDSKKVQNESLAVLKNIIDDIYNTRYKLDDICAKNYLSYSRFNKLLIDENYLDDRFGKGTREKIKNKLKETSIIRTKGSRNEHIIEDRIQLLIVKPQITHLNTYDFKKLSLAASYIENEANVQEIVNKHNIDFISVIAALSDPKLSQILKEEYYLKLNRYISIEKLLLGNRIVEKQKFIYEIIGFLGNNGFDKNVAIEYFNLPKNLFNRILNEITNLTYINDEIKIKIKDILTDETGKKIR